MTLSTRLAVALILTLAVAPAADSVGRTRAPAHCPHVRGKVVLSTSQVKVVRQARPYGVSVLFGCSRPTGLLRRLGVAPYNGGSDFSSVDAVSAVGTWVRIDIDVETSLTYGGTNRLVDARTGRGYTVLTYDKHDGNPFRPHPTLDSFLWDTRGRSATAISTPTGVDEHGSPTGYDEAIAVHAPDGTTITLDHGSPSAIPPSSLAYQQGVVSWTHDGEPRAVLFS